MRILLIHNIYKQAGGEDSVFKSEYNLLLRNGHFVETIIYNNTRIKTTWDKFLSGIKSFYNPDSARQIKEKIRLFKPDIIHVHNFLPLISPSVFFVANQFNVPIVLTLHNYRLICPSATLFYNGKLYEKSIHTIFPWDAIWNGVYRHSKVQTAAVAFMTASHHFLGTWKNKIGAYITLTEFAKDKIEHSALAIPSERFFVKPNFVEDCGEGNNKRENYFLFIGRLTEEKGIRTLLKAINFSDFKLIIIGDGPLKTLVEDCAKNNSSITYLGFKPKAVVMSYMKRCKALIFPSIWFEGFPLTIAEAFSTSTVVISSKLGGMEEIIEDGENGLHFEPGNAYDLSKKISEILKNESMAKLISKNARHTYEKYYTPTTNYRQLINIYLKTIEQREQHSSANVLPQLVTN